MIQKLTFATAALNDRFGSRLFTLRCTKDWYRIAKRTFGGGDKLGS